MSDFCQQTSATSRGLREGYRPLSAADLEKVHQFESKSGHSLEEVEDECAGCVVFTKDPTTNELMVLLIENYGNWYSFPKGHKDVGEDDVTTAIRETAEEVGIQLTKEQIIPQSQRDVKYTLVGKMHKDRWSSHPDYPDETKRPMVITYKRVAHFSAMIPYPSDDNKPVPQVCELKGVAFHTIEEALKLLGPVIGPQLETQLETLKGFVL
jgi:8-oxo-dGTP pyrophosphatase MutT (NUDIX family)